MAWKVNAVMTRCSPRPLERGSRGYLWRVRRAVWSCHCVSTSGDPVGAAQPVGNRGDRTALSGAGPVAGSVWAAVPTASSAREGTDTVDSTATPAAPRGPGWRLTDRED